MVLASFLIGCSSGNKEQSTTTVEEYTGEPIEFGTPAAKISKKEAKSIAKDSLMENMIMIFIRLK